MLYAVHMLKSDILRTMYAKSVQVGRYAMSQMKQSQINFTILKKIRPLESIWSNVHDHRYLISRFCAIVPSGLHCKFHNRFL